MSGYDDAREAVRRQEQQFHEDNNRGLYELSDHPCYESHSPYGSCSRSDEGKHYTHEARNGAGQVLGRWRIREPAGRVIETVDPNVAGIGRGD